MIKNWPKIYAFTHEFEVGIADNPKDPGGYTVDGLTLATYREYHPGASAKTLRGLSSRDKMEFFFQYFWSPSGANILESGVDLYAFELSVNNGGGLEHEFISITSHLSGEARIRKLDQLRLGFWKHLVREWPVFRKGWCRRENACLKLALELHKGA